GEASSVRDERDRGRITSVGAAEPGDEAAEVQLQRVRADIQRDVVEYRGLHRLARIARGGVGCAGIEHRRAHGPCYAPVARIAGILAGGAAVDRGIPRIDGGTDEGIAVRLGAERGA